MSAGSVRVVKRAGKLAERMKQKGVLSLTDAAVNRLKFLKQKSPKPIIGFRLGVKQRGCNGLSYTLDYADEKQKFEDEVDANGVKVFISPQAVMTVIGTEMDFVDDKLKSEFVFHNPNATSACGCGESFNTD